MPDAIECPECRLSYQDHSKLFLKTCESCHLVCKKCIQRTFQDEENYQDKNECWLLGEDCDPDLHHMICPQCEQSTNVFHIMDNDLHNLTSLKDYLHQISLDKRKEKLKSDFERDFKELKSLCDKALQVLQKLKTELNERANNCRISKITGATTGLVGSALFITGAVLAPFTFGASTPLMIAGGVVGGVGGGVAGGTGIVEMVINKETAKEVQQEFQRVRKKYCKMVNNANLYRIALCFDELNPSMFTGSAKFTANVGLGIFRLVQVIGESGGAAFRFSTAGLRVSTIVLHSVGSALAAVTAVFDIVTIAVNSKELHYNEPAEYSAKIDEAMEGLREIQDLTMEKVMKTRSSDHSS